MELYGETRSFPTTERFGLVAQIRRAAVSIPVNIAKGAGRRSRKEFARFLSISRGSANELFVLLDIARDIGLLAEIRFASYTQSIERIFAMTSGLIRRIDPDGLR